MEQKKIVDLWFKDINNFDLAAKTWNSMNLGVKNGTD